VGADIGALMLYTSRVIGWVSDFGTESDIPNAPAIDLKTFLQQCVQDADGLVDFLMDEGATDQPNTGGLSFNMSTMV
jgi:hypothetical protein